jgi:drug/metabolite transporter (DMT)-like permease
LILTHLSLFVAAVIWGGNFAAVRVMLDEITPFDVVFLRVTGAALLLITLLLVSERRLPAIERRHVLPLAAIGVLGVVIPNVAIVHGQAVVSAALASLIVTSNPIHTALISRAISGEPLTGRKIGGIALAFAGFIIALVWGSTDGVVFDAEQLTGVAIIAIAPLAWAFYTVLSRPYVVAYPSLDVATLTTVAGAVVLAPLVVVDPRTISRIGQMAERGWIAALFATVVAFVLGYALWYRGLRVLTPSRAAVYLYLVPVFGILSAWFVLDERPTVWLLLGGSIILAGVFLTNSAATEREPAGREPGAEPARPAA